MDSRALEVLWVGVTVAVGVMMAVTMVSIAVRRSAFQDQLQAPTSYGVCPTCTDPESETRRPKRQKVLPKSQRFLRDLDEKPATLARAKHLMAMVVNVECVWPLPRPTKFFGRAVALHIARVRHTLHRFRARADRHFVTSGAPQGLKTEQLHSEVAKRVRQGGTLVALIWSRARPRGDLVTLVTLVALVTMQLQHPWR